MHKTTKSLLGHRPSQGRPPLEVGTNDTRSLRYTPLSVALLFRDELADLDQALDGALANIDGPSLIAVQLPPKDMPAELRPAPPLARFATGASHSAGATVNTAAFN